jgi:two-component system alkaline phosphatase synthesis response regulator PhoP
MSAKKILLVEDEVNLASIIQLNLEMENYEVHTCDNGLHSIDKFKSINPDLVILDIMLPELNGIEVCKQLKKINSQIPILFLSAKSSGIEKIEGLKSGGDDYLTKPFNLEELILRVQNLVRRLPVNKQEDVFTLDEFIINFTNFTIHYKHKLINPITSREFKLLKILTSREGQVISRDEIIKQLWLPSENPSSRTIDNYILNFRKIFEVAEKKYFHSIRGIGYKFKTN